MVSRVRVIGLRLVLGLGLGLVSAVQSFRRSVAVRLIRDRGNAVDFTLVQLVVIDLLLYLVA